MRTNSQTTRKWTWINMLWILFLSPLNSVVAPAWAEELATATAQNPTISPSLKKSDLVWVELPSVAEGPRVRIWYVGRPLDAGVECYVITHGMGGTASGDRFHRLAEAIHKRFPRACVLLVDWSEKSSAKPGSYPNPWKVAVSIDEVGDQAARLLKHGAIDPAKTTLIGESFGNWVNARLARQLGGVQGILAMNPAHEAGGYVPPDLRKHAKHSWSFHTYSIYDTTLEIADGDFWLATSDRANHLEQHVSGINWLTARLEAGDPSWLHMDRPLPQRREGHFRASATMDGKLLEQQQPRQRPALTEISDGSANPLATDFAVAK